MTNREKGVGRIVAGGASIPIYIYIKEIVGRIERKHCRDMHYSMMDGSRGASFIYQGKV